MNEFLAPWHILLLFGIALYLLPSIIAITRKVPNWGSAVVLNIFGGFLIFGWVIAMMMACRSKYQTVMVPQYGYGQQPYPPQPQPMPVQPPAPEPYGYEEPEREHGAEYR